MRTPWWQWSSIKLALVFAVFGLLAGGFATVYPGLRPTFLILYWTALFAAALLQFLTPERRIRAKIGEHVYAELAANEAALITAYQLHDVRVYVPKRGSMEDPPARLFVPRHSKYDIPVDELDSLLVVSDVEEHQGVSLLPSGGRLFREFESMLRNDLNESPGELATQLADGVTEGLELADRVTLDVRPAEQHIDFEITDNVYGPLDRFDHPVQSFLAIGLAVGLDQPVAIETRTKDRSDNVVSCRWGLGERHNDTERAVVGRGSVPPNQ